MSWSWWIILPSLPISSISITLSQQRVLLNYFCTTFIVYMACRLLLSQTTTVFLQVNFGRNFSYWLTFSWTCLPYTILNQMARHSVWIRLWKYSSVALSRHVRPTRQSGFALRNFGTTPHPIQVSIFLLMWPSTVMSLDTSAFIHLLWLLFQTWIRGSVSVKLWQHWLSNIYPALICLCNDSQISNV